jgi:DNA-binding IscR family transcriptional regulator
MADKTRQRFLRYSLKALLLIEGQGRMKSADIHRALDLPTRYLEPGLQQLVRAGVLRGLRGQTGGFEIGAPLDSVTIAAVTAALRNVPADARPHGPNIGGVDALFASIDAEANDRLALVTVGSLRAADEELRAA